MSKIVKCNECGSGQKRFSVKNKVIIVALAFVIIGESNAGMFYKNDDTSRGYEQKGAKVQNLLLTSSAAIGEGTTESPLFLSSFGAVGDGKTNDTFAFNKLKAAYPINKVTVQLSRSYRIASSVSIPSNIELKGTNGAKIIPDKNVQFNASNISGIEIVTPFHGYQLNASSSDVKLKNSNITAGGYGILINAASKGKNLDIIENNISSKADAIEINTVGGNFSQIKILGNSLNALGTNGDINSGFAIGIAKGKDIIVANNIVEHSRREAVHIEDAQERIIVSNNILKGCYKDGAVLLNRSGAKPIIFTGNQIKKDDSNLSSDSGIYTVWDPTGTLSGNVLTDNIIDGFNAGLNLNGYGTHNINGNTIINCRTAIYNAYGIASGKIIATNCPTLVKGNSGSRTGKIVSTTEPTTILEYAGKAGHLGATLEGFNFPKSTVTTAIGTNKRVLFALPTTFSGVLTLEFSGGANHFKYTSDVSYDGKNLVVGKKLIDTSGVISNLSLVIIGKNLVLTYYTSAKINLFINIDFQGDFYKS